MTGDKFDDDDLISKKLGSMFDGSGGARVFKEWLDDIITIMRLKDGGIDAYLEEEHSATPRPERYVDPDLMDKEMVPVLDDESKPVMSGDEPMLREETDAEFAARKKLVKKEQAVRKGMSKAFAVLLAYTKGQPKRMIVKRQESKDEKNTPYWALQDLIEKYDHGTETLDYLELERQWNAFTVPSSTTDPEEVFLYLEELSEKLGKVGEKYRKDELQYFAKLSQCMPSIYDMCYRVADSNLEGERVPIEVKVERYKELCRETFRKDVKATADNKKKDLLFYANEEEKKKVVCDFCKKKGHVAVQDGEVICRTMKSKFGIGQGTPDNTSNQASGNDGGNFKFKCHHCKKPGHKKKDCPERAKSESAKDGNESEKSDINGLFISCLFSEKERKDCEEIKGKDTRSYADAVRGIPKHNSKFSQQEERILGLHGESEKLTILNCSEKRVRFSCDENPNMTEFLADSGASVHACIASNVSKQSNGVGVIYGANGSSMKVQAVENRMYETESGTQFELRNLRVIEGLKKNIISIGALLEDNWSLEHTKDKDTISLVKDGSRLIFHRNDGNLFSLRSKLLKGQEIYLGIKEENLYPKENEWTRVKEKHPKVLATTSDEYMLKDINDFHDQYGHKSERVLLKTAEANKVELTGTLKKCDSCAIVKVKRTPVKHSTDAISTYVGERMYLDISGPFNIRKTLDDPYKTEERGNLYWMGLSDQYSSKMLMSFGTTKDGLYSMLEECIVHMDVLGHPIKTIRMDNAAENTSRALKRLCDENGIKIELTPPDTPKLNGVVERGFAIRWEIAKTLMQAARLQNDAKHIRDILEGAIRTAGMMHDRTYSFHMKCSPNDRFYKYSGNRESVKEKHIVPWGSVGMVLTTNKPSKFNLRGEPMLMIGYAMNHPSGTYRFYNPKSKSVVLSNNVKWTEWKRWEVSNEDLNRLLEHDGSTDENFSNNPYSSLFDDEDDMDDVSDDAVEIEAGGSTKQDNSNVLEPTSIENTVETTSDTPAFIEHSDDDDEAAIEPITSIRSPIMTRSRTKNAINTMNETKRIKVTGDTKSYRILSKNGTMNPYPYAGGTNSALSQDELLMCLMERILTLETCDEEIWGDSISSALRKLQIYHTCIQNDDDTPETWRKALQGDNKEEWSQATISEFNNFLKRGAWKLVKIEKVRKEGRKIVPVKLVFKKKDEADGTIRFKVRCVTLGFMMIPGVDFTEKFSPVATDESKNLQIALTLWFQGKGKKDWIMRSLDVEAAFLEPSMDKPMYIGIHQALVDLGFITQEEAEEYAIELQNSMYGNVDAALKFFDLFTKYLVKECGMTQSKCDPCLLYMRKNGELILIMTITVDDCAISGKDNDIENLMKKIEKRFKITKEGIIRKHLGAKYEWKVDEHGRRICECTMDKKVQELVQKYENHTKSVAKKYESPGKPGENLSKWEGDSVDINAYRSITGLAMFFGTKMGPKPSNAIRSISRFMSNPGKEHWKAIGRLIGYLKHAKFNGIRYVEPESLELIYMCDTDLGNDLETRRSVGSTIGTLGGCVVDFWSNLHDTVSISSTEAEYKELSKCARGAKFMQMMCEELLGVQVDAYLCEDNEGAGFLSLNKQVGKRTKHIDIHHHYIREFVTEHDGRVRGKVIMIGTEENVADIGTKNVSVEIFKRHAHEIDHGFPKLRISAYGPNGFVRTNAKDG
jgi:hypothetical protein